MAFVRASGTTVIKYPYRLRDFKAEFPSVSPPKEFTNPGAIAEYGIFPVVETTPPVNDVVKEVDPVLQGGDWLQSWSDRAYTTTELRLIAEREDREAARAAVKADPQVRALLQAQPDQIDTYVDNNVTDLASAKQVIAIIARAVSITAQSFLADSSDSV